MKHLLPLFIFVISLSGCSYTYNARARAIKKADMLEIKGNYSEAHKLRLEAPFMPEEKTGHYIPLVQKRPDDEIEKYDPYRIPESPDSTDFKYYEFKISTSN